jgi:predicted TIM-barrel fold metal-dependent hydrolase
LVIDTETHVLLFARNSWVNPHSTRVKHFTWHEHDGDLLVAEMDAAGVDQTILISYDAEDIRFSEEHKGFEIGDFAGGRKYTLLQVHRHPERFHWVSTLKDAERVDVCAQIDRDLAEGAEGFKLFPAYVYADLTSPAWTRVFRYLRDQGTRLLISFETLLPPETYDLETYLGQLRHALDHAEGLPVALLHAGCEDPLAPGRKFVPEFLRDHPAVVLSMAMPGAVWDDGTEYPYPNLLNRVRILRDAVGADRLMWATDWPWFGDRFLYGQGVDCFRLHADFFTPAELHAFMGGTAERFLHVNGRGGR